MSKKVVASHRHQKRKPSTFWGVRRTVWFGIAKWISIAGFAVAGLISAIASLIQAIRGK